MGFMGKSGKSYKLTKLSIFLVASLNLIAYQNCSNPIDFQHIDNTTLDSENPVAPEDNLDVCDNVSCDLTPITKAPAVTTILMALGDEADSQLVVNGTSAQLIAESAIRYSSPVENPKILLVNDFANGAESSEDTLYVRDVLLSRYQVEFLEETQDGLSEENLLGYDLVWYNNPGHSMGNVTTRDTLLAFSGGIVLQGDDLTRGRGFDLEDLTGLRFLDNGTNVSCSGIAYHHDNNTGERYRVSLDANKIPGASSETIRFYYGNDIDNSQVIRNDLEVIATAVGGPEECYEERPAIVRYVKQQSLGN